MKSRLTVIIPTLTNLKGIKYLTRYFKGKNYDLVIVDNSRKNRGFAGGINYGAKKAKSKWMLFLNDDIEFKDGITLDKLVKEAEKKKIDALSPILRNRDGRVENYGYKVLPYGKVELVKKIPKPLQGDDKDVMVSPPAGRAGPANRDIDGLTAACLLIKTNVFKKLKGFDESFFAYLEDVDFFLRFKTVGYKMGMSSLEVKHNHMTTSRRMGNFKARQDMVNWWRLYFKHKERFRFDLSFFIERMRNLNGYIKATLKSFDTY